MIWILISIVTLALSVYVAFDRQPIDSYPNDERSVLYIDFSHDQIGDFAHSEEIKDEILHIDINTLTPVEALMKLNEIKRMLIKKKRD